MAEFVELNLRVRAETQEEVDRILECAYSGMASEVIRLSALYGIGMNTAMTPTVASPVSYGNSEVQSVTVEKPTFKKVETEAAGSTSLPAAPEKPKRTKLLGQQRKKRV